MKIAIGNDHRGFEAKKQVKAIITQLGHECIDVGTDGSDPVDYPDPAYLAAMAVSKKQADRAILACGTGIGDWDEYNGEQSKWNQGCVVP
jgi:ribose 5-phosphate isomerase B